MIMMSLPKGRKSTDFRSGGPSPSPGAGGQVRQRARAAHLVSWAGRAPLDHQSGQRKGRSKRKKGNRYIGAATGETSVSAGRTQTREGARYRRLAGRIGKDKAQVAVGNTRLTVYHKLLSNPGMRYQDLGADYYDKHA
jgi:hypothetical protein